MAAAQQLARAGHDVHLYERNLKAGGLLRYGIPDFKMEKHGIDQRVAQMEAEGVTFHYGVHAGGDTLDDKHDAYILACGSEVPRDLPVTGRELDGVHFAMDFLPQQNRRIGQEPIGDGAPILAEGKHVIVIGGGDTGSDCIGTSFRQGALSVTQLEIMPMPPEKENKAMTWPDWPLKMRTSSSQAEGAVRDFSVMTTQIQGKDGHVTAIQCTKIDDNMQAIAGSEFDLKADLVLLAMGFVHPVHEGLVDDLGLAKDDRGNVAADTATYETSRAKTFACGDMRRGQSLVVWAIREGSPMRPRGRFILDGRNATAPLTTEAQQIIEHALDMFHRITHLFMRAISTKTFHFAIAAIPCRFGFWVEPNHAARALVDFFQHQMPGVAIIGARIAQNHHGCARSRCCPASPRPSPSSTCHNPLSRRHIAAEPIPSPARCRLRASCRISRQRDLKKQKSASSASPHRDYIRTSEKTATPPPPNQKHRKAR